MKSLDFKIEKGIGGVMKKKKLLFIYNPKSGKEKIRNYLLDIIDIFVKADYEVTIYPTQKPGDAIQATAYKSEEYDTLVCSGGDGTLGDVVMGMMHCPKKIPIGYIPSGSTNDFAKSLKLPKKLNKAAEVAVKGRAFPCDIGLFNGDSFVYIAGFGMFTDVSYATSQDMKNILGHMAYVLEGMKRISSIKSYAMKVEYDNQVIEGDFIFGMVTNSLSVGGFKRITGKNVQLDDGVFEVTLIKSPSTVVELNAATSALLDKYIDTSFMYCFKTSNVVFTMKAEIPWTLDGEFGGNHQKVEIENIKRAVDIII